MTAEEFLIDTIEHYSVDPDKRRSIDSDHQCKYYPAKSTSEGCAIGRHLDKDLAQKMDNCRLSVIKNASKIPEFALKAPLWMIKLDVELLRDCQRLHDYDDNWTSNGLSVAGKHKVNEIVTSNRLDASKFLKYYN